MAELIASVIIDGSAPRSGQTVSGYGKRIPTRYRLRCSDNRIRRVYMMQYANSGTAYVRIDGNVHALTLTEQHAIEQACDENGVW